MNIQNLNYKQLIKEAKVQIHQGHENTISASSIKACALCPGRHNTALGLMEKDNEYSIEGTAKHMCIEQEYIPNDAPPEFKEDVKFCLDKVNQFIELGWSVVSKEIYMELLRENKPYLTGKCDLVMRKGVAYLYIDYKTGKEFVDSDDIQLKAYAVLGQRYFPKASEHYLIAVQPAFPDKEPVMIHMPECEQEILGILDKSYGSFDRVPTPEACVYCPAKATERCPETLDMLVKLPDRTEINPHKMAEYLTQIRIIEPVIKAVKAKAVELLEAGKDIEGYRLQKGKRIRVIADTGLAYNKVSEKISLEDFLASCTISPKAIEALLIESGETKKGIEDRSKEILGELIVESLSKPYVMKKAKR
jgi:hypothetical protein